MCLWSQTLVDVPCANLASALGFQQKKAQALQDTLQTVLDRREESRQSKDLLQLYLKTVESEREQEASQEAGGWFFLVFLKYNISFSTSTLPL